MGYARWDQGQWDRYAQGLHGRSRDQIFTAREIDPKLDPRRIDVRESRDSEANPQATPVIVAVDVTGSMGHLAEELVRSGVASVMEALLERRPVPDPHLMCMGVGDVRTDAAPLQVTQFETDLRIVRQLSDVWIEGGGGGNGAESYVLAWAFAATKTACDAFARGRKGYLFTVGDDGPEGGLTRRQIEGVLGIDPRRDLSSRELLELASRDWEVFHLTVEQGGTMSERVRRDWRDLLGERAIALRDHRDMADAIVGAIEATVATGATGATGADGATVADEADDARADPRPAYPWGAPRPGFAGRLRAALPGPGR